MKKVLSGLVAAMVVFGLVGCAGLFPPTASTKDASEGMAVKSKPILLVATPYVKMHKKAVAVIMGTNFTPGQKITVLFTDKNGVESDIGYALKPEPKADKTGTWSSTWGCGRFIQKKLVKANAYVITVTDSDYNPIVSAPIAFYAAGKKKKKKK